MKRTEYLAQFWKAKAADRKKPGHCTHCGAKKTEADKHVQCNKCLAKQRERAKRRRLKKKQLSLTVFPERFAELVATVNALQVRSDNLLRRVRNEYQRGKRAGELAAMRKAVQLAQKPVPALSLIHI